MTPAALDSPADRQPREGAGRPCRRISKPAIRHTRAHENHVLEAQIHSETGGLILAIDYDCAIAVDDRRSVSMESSNADFTVVQHM